MIDQLSDAVFTYINTLYTVFHSEMLLTEENEKGPSNVNDSPKCT